MNTPNANRLPTFKKIPPQTVSTGKKALADTNSKWKRKHLNTIDGDEKEEAVKKVKTAADSGAKLGRDIIIGFNSVMRVIEAGDAEIVCVGHDGPAAMLKCLVEAAKAKSVVTVAVPKLNHSIRNILSLKSVSCFALKKAQASHEGVNSEEATELLDAIHAAIDDLREFLLSL
jgi:ribosomal protein L7Ae-like RNA K-turn-binding protein